MQVESEKRRSESRRRIVVGVAAASAALLLGGALTGGSSPDLVLPSREEASLPDRAAATPQEPLARLLEGFSTGDTAGYVRQLERSLEADPYDDETLTLLGLAYQQLARESGDPSYYTLSGRALARTRPDDPVAVTARSSLANSRHRFLDALAHARRALSLDAESASAHGALGDALFNLGRYDDAFAAFDRMAELAPSVGSFARVAFARELLGRPTAAIEAMELALEAGSTVPEYTAWAYVQLGNLHFSLGELEPALGAYRLALGAVPGYVHAEAGIARVESAQGRFDGAARRLERVLERLPAPAYAILRGDVLAAAGRAAEAREAYALVEALERLLAANGIRTELETALYDLDHDRNLPDALVRAESAFAAAPSVRAEDVLAWAHLKNGRCREARAHSVRALRFGTKDAQMLFHRGMIERCLGNEKTGRSFVARALGTNPYFSLLYAPVAREILG